MMYERRAMTRIGVIVSLTLGLLLVGMLVVAIGRVREEANRVQCQNNLRQIGLAISNYRDSASRLPLLTDYGQGAPTGRGLVSLFAHIWPYCESSPWRYTSDMSVDRYHAPTSTQFNLFSKVGQHFTQMGGLANQHLRLFLDSGDLTADQLRDVRMTLPDGVTGYYATGSYAANGLVPWGTKATPSSVSRGIENTVMMTEKPQVCKTATGEVVYNLWGLGFFSPNMPAFATLTPADPPGLLSTGQVAPIVPLRQRDLFDSEETIDVRVGRQDAPIETMTALNPLQRIYANQPCDPRLPGGPHAAGLQTLMADASVRTFGWDTSPRVFWAACSPVRPAEE
jgi:Protein of unknown function (DUF1559)